ncbi:hypothetical protein IDSA_07055 [Pseudidiomarina salinarum]|uniref:Uncharacterized protein n=1 Tax=Pseudidiomarina salinarum TaxID=435908 RepID=A0A094JE82_9GAMM|nr:hypothetical protein [Pseudidiomarina salinarum]KFZ30836.1 hypothetical protein IDSA_07055 [Pseudidiomarina salinarum]RUO71306.1 hypothetical protein CWI79_07740 [Pseudidiomarina salinarum]
MKYILTLVALSIFSVPGFAAEDATTSADAETVEVNLAFQVGDDEFTDLQAVAYVGKPMSIYITHPVSSIEYKASFTVNTLSHNDKDAAQVYLNVQKKLAGAWSNVESIETLQYMNDTASFSIGGQDAVKLAGRITAKASPGK